MDNTRHYDIIAPDMISRWPAVLIGTGGIGAATAVAITKMGIPYIDLFDPDTVDEVNIPTQMLPVSDIGMSKVVSVSTMLKHFSDEIEGKAHIKRVKKDTTLPAAPIVISALDSINARKDVWEAVFNQDNIKFYLDARMGAEVFQLFTINFDQPWTWYSSQLAALNEDDVPDLPCTARATIYTAFIAAGHIAHQIKRIVMGDPIPKLLVHDIANFQTITPAGFYE